MLSHVRVLIPLGLLGYLIATGLLVYWGYTFRLEIDNSFGEKYSDWYWGILYSLGIEDRFAATFGTMVGIATVLYFSLHLMMGRVFGNIKGLWQSLAVLGSTQWQISIGYVVGIVICPFSLLFSVSVIALTILINVIISFSWSFKWFEVTHAKRGNYTYIFFSLFILIYLLISFSLSLLSKTDLPLVGGDHAPVTEKEYLKTAFSSEFDQYDVVVYGGEAEGVAAAVAAARNGLQTLLIEPRNGLGGLLTFSKLNYFDLPQTREGRIVSGGIFKEFHRKVNFSRVADIEQMKQALMTMLRQEKNIDLSLETSFMKPILEGNVVKGVRIQSRNGTKNVLAKRFIDASQDADFAAAAGVPFFTGSEDLNIKERYMAVTPVIHLKGVSWRNLKKAVKSYKFGYASMTTNTIAGFGKLFDMYQPKNPNTRLRGLNVARVANKNGEEVFINALLVFYVNGLDEKQRKEALRVGNLESEHVVEFLRKEMSGFEKAEIVSPATELYIRETRHVFAEYQLQMADLWYQRDHWDSIGYGSYPVDIQPYTPFDKGAIVADPERYAIPFRTLVPKKIENILIAGRSAGYSSVAFGSARVIPTGMVTGEASGVAAKVSIEHDLTFRQMTKQPKKIEQLRTLLDEQGAEVSSFESDYPYKGEWFSGKIGFLLDYGVVLAGYENDLQVDRPFTAGSFKSILSNGARRTNAEWDQQNRKNIESIVVVPERPITRDEAANHLARIFLQTSQSEQDWQQLREANVIDDVIYKRLPKNRTLNRAEGLYLMSTVLQLIKSSRIE